ncbi:MAG: hypothetical protein K5745_07095 [Saccharofermentans sp.]|nr:hypothetical protein [Saccharofermentans sp.]
MGLFGFGRPSGKWIRQSHFFGGDTFECSVCGRELSSASSTCPKCGADMNGIADKYDLREIKQRRDDIEEEFDEIDGIDDADY